MNRCIRSGGNQASLHSHDPKVSDCEVHEHVIFMLSFKSSKRAVLFRPSYFDALALRVFLFIIGGTYNGPSLCLFFLFLFAHFNTGENHAFCYVASLDMIPLRFCILSGFVFHSQSLCNFFKTKQLKPLSHNASRLSSCAPHWIIYLALIPWLIACLIIVIFILCLIMFFRKP